MSRPGRTGSRSGDVCYCWAAVAAFMDRRGRINSLAFYRSYCVRCPGSPDLLYKVQLSDNGVDRSRGTTLTKQSIR
jgi:hypothetical protein